MKLVRKDTQEQVKCGDIVESRDRTQYTIEFFREPHKPSSEGKIMVCEIKNGIMGMAPKREYYVSVVGLEWIEREDRKDW